MQALFLILTRLVQKWRCNDVPKPGIGEIKANTGCLVSSYLGKPTIPLASVTYLEMPTGTTHHFC